ncbi:MAG TPA: hypothetical protein PLQ13_07635 [Candidatus Krumholzibacteria bacterium]|nr:hypothetical protein [Candidatus Krumholzibacteria bacterium]
MSANEHDNLDPGQRLAQDAVRSLGSAPVDPEFRARLKAQFTAGAIPDEGPVVLSAPAPRSRGEFWGWGLLAAAALAVAVLTGLNPLPGPRLLGSRGEGEIVVDGTTVAAADEAGLGRLLRPGARIETAPGTVIDLEYPGSLTMRVEGGSLLELPARPGRWHHRDVTAGLAVGEISVRTGPKLAGGRLDVTTPQGEARIYGTLINVYTDSVLSCFCLHDGTAHVHRADGVDLGAVPPMMRRVTFTDGREPDLSPIAPPHLADMQAMERDLGLSDRR